MSDTELKQYKRSFLKDEVLMNEGEKGSEILRLHLMEICADDQTGNMGRDLLLYFLTTNPWGLQHGDKKQVIDFKFCSIKVPNKIDSDELLS